MSPNSPRARYSRGWMRTFYLSFFMFIAACSSDGCGCAGFEERPFPAEHFDKTVPLMGQVQVTEHALRFIEDQTGNVLATVMEEQQSNDVTLTVDGDNLSMCLLKGESNGVTYCVDSVCNDGQEGCQIDLKLSDVNVNPVPFQQLEMELIIGDVDELIKFDYSSGFLNAKCEIQLHKKNASEATPAEITGHWPIDFIIDNNTPTRDLKIQFGEITLNIDDLAFEARGRQGFGNAILCPTAEVIVRNLFMGFIENEIKGQINNAVQTGIRQQLCKQCGEGLEACPDNSTCQTIEEDQVCMKNNSDECVQRTLGVEGRVLMGSLMDGFTMTPQAALDVMVKAADHAMVETGVGIGLRGGFQATSHDRCIPVENIQRPDFDPIQYSNILRSEVHPNANKNYMAGIAVHKKTLDHLLWSAWASGVLCFKITTESLDMLSTGALGALLPSVSNLTTGNQEAFVQISPQNAPTVILGANTITQSGSNNVIDDALITLDWKDLDIHFYGYVQDRYARLFTLRSDISLPLGVMPDTGGIQFILGDVPSAIQNVRLHGPSLLEEDEQRLADLLPTLLGVALPALLETLADPIALPEFFGYRIALEQEDITSFDNNNFIGLFANLERAPSVSDSISRGMVQAIQPMILETSLNYSTKTQSGIYRPVLDVKLATFYQGNRNNPVEHVEYSYQLNNGFWSAYTATDRLSIKDPVLTLQGHHKLSVRSRVKNGQEFNYGPEQSTDIIVDYDAPQLDIHVVKNTITLAATDVVDQAKDLQYRYRIVDGVSQNQWSDWTSETTFMLDPTNLPELVRVDAEVRDRSGHIRGATQSVRVSALDIDDIIQTANDTMSGSGCGCSSTGSPTPSSWAGNLALGLALCGGLWWRRRKRFDAINRILSMTKLSKIMLIGCSLLLLLGSVGCKSSNVDDTKQCEGDECPEPCVGDDCEPVACEDDGVCAAGCSDGQMGLCIDGSCQCRDYCEEGCGENQYCCFEENLCRDLPDPCEKQVCDEGYEPSAVDVPTAESASCEVTAGTCECVKLPDLPLGWHGSYASIASNGTVTAASVYNRTYRDLMVATLDNSLNPTWYWVDGMPEEGTIAGAIDGPRNGISTPGPRVGTYTSTAVDTQGTIHVLYQDQDNFDLKYARGVAAGNTYDFTSVTLDTDGETGYWTSMQLVDDTLHAVYSTFQHQVEEQWQSQLRYISLSIADAPDAIVVEPQILHISRPAIPCPDGCEDGQKCFESTASCEVPSTNCVGSCGTYSACLNGQCEQTYAANRARSFPRVASLLNQLTIGKNGNLLVTFYDGSQKKVGYIVHKNGTWGQPNLLNSASGPYVGGQIDGNGTIHLAYMAPQRPALVYWNSGAVRGGSDAEIIMDGVRDNELGWTMADIGENVTLQLLDDNSVQVSFQDSTAHRLYSAVRESQNNWNISPIAGHTNSYTGSHGFYHAVSANNGALYGIEMVLKSEDGKAITYPAFYKLQ